MGQKSITSMVQKHLVKNIIWFINIIPLVFSLIRIMLLLLQFFSLEITFIFEEMGLISFSELSIGWIKFFCWVVVSVIYLSVPFVMEAN